MPQETSYSNLVDAFSKIPSAEVEAPSLPVDVAVQEGNDLHRWALEDKQKLEKVIDWALVESLPERAAALREAESRWLMQRYERSEARAEWSRRLPEAEDLRSELLHTFRYSYRNVRGLKTRLRQIARGGGHSDLIQDLNDLGVIGKNNTQELEQIGFDMQLLQQAADMSHSLSNILAEARSTKEYNEAKDIRDRAFTYLNKAVDEIREAGQYLFWRQPDRAVGYASDYFRRTTSSDNKESTTSSIM